MAKFDDRRHTLGLAVAMILFIASVVVSYAIVSFAETCEIDIGFGDIVAAVKSLITERGCQR